MSAPTSAAFQAFNWRFETCAYQFSLVARFNDIGSLLRAAWASTHAGGFRAFGLEPERHGAHGPIGLVLCSFIDPISIAGRSAIVPAENALISALNTCLQPVVVCTNARGAVRLAAAAHRITRGRDYGLAICVGEVTALPSARRAMRHANAEDRERHVMMHTDTSHEEPFKMPDLNEDAAEVVDMCAALVEHGHVQHAAQMLAIDLLAARADGVTMPVDCLALDTFGQLAHFIGSSVDPRGQAHSAVLMHNPGRVHGGLTYARSLVGSINRQPSSRPIEVRAGPIERFVRAGVILAMDSVLGGAAWCVSGLGPRRCLMRRRQHQVRQHAAADQRLAVLVVDPTTIRQVYVANAKHPPGGDAALAAAAWARLGTDRADDVSFALRLMIDRVFQLDASFFLVQSWTGLTGMHRAVGLGPEAPATHAVTPTRHPASVATTHAAPQHAIAAATAGMPRSRPASVTASIRSDTAIVDSAAVRRRRDKVFQAIRRLGRRTQP